MASSRDAILATVRAAKVPQAARPEPFRTGIRYADPLKQFGESLAAVGGKMIVAPNAESARAQLLENPLLVPGKKTCSLLPEIIAPTFSLDDVADPHDVEDVWLAVLPGEFAVAENAAVWFLGRRLKHRVVPFITQHLVLVVPRDQVVNNMHEAYDRLKFGTVEFGVFLSGPSKTADIEQSLVIGAHGARSPSGVMLG
ncbi:MAG: LUD domain-containing protein [Planctomycetota bacterium]|nr:LUD domain-containing protein [Planctomycetota bacterium]